MTIRYLHYWAYQPADPSYTAAWPHLVKDARVIVRRARRVGISIKGPDGTGEPRFDLNLGIAFGGDESLGEHRDQFQLDPPDAAAGETWIRQGIATGRQPYDAAVTALLLRAHMLLPTTMLINSTGGWDEEWAHGAWNNRIGRPAALMIARDVIGDLYDGYPSCPFRPTGDTPARQSSTAVSR